MVHSALFMQYMRLCGGEVLAQILPYSAVRVRAVLLTDLYTEKAFERSGRKSRRALLVREPVVRPAHFERHLTSK